MNVLRVMGLTVGLGLAMSVQATMVQHLMGTNSASITTNDAGIVTQWDDLSGNDNNATTSSVGFVTYPSTSVAASGLNGVNFTDSRTALELFSSADSDALLDFTGGAAGNSGFAVLIAFKADHLVQDWNDLLGNTTVLGAGFGMRYDKNGAVQSYLTGTSVGGGFVPAGATVVYAFNYDVSATNQMQVLHSGDGILRTAEKAPGDFSNAAPILMGTLNNDGRFIDGLIGEVRVFDAALTSNELATAYAEMVNTWVVPATNVIYPPEGFTAIPSDSLAILDWYDNVQVGFVTSYNVYSSTNSGSENYTLLASGITNSAYDVTNLVNDTTYYFATTCVDLNGNESAFSDEDSALPYTIAADAVYLMNYEANEGASITTDGADGVTLWANQVTNVYDATPSGGGSALYPGAALSATGLKGVDFTATDVRLELMDATESDELLDMSDGSSGFVVMVALGIESPRNQQDFLGNSTAVGAGFGLRYNGFLSNSGDITFQPWLAGAVGVGTTANTGDTVVVTFRYDSLEQQAVFWESASGNTATLNKTPADFSLDNKALSLGRTEATGRNFGGNIYEVKIWASTLDDATMESERAELVQKWVAGAPSYTKWAGSWGVDIGSEADDYDNDLLDNLHEYGVNGNPTSALDGGIEALYSVTMDGSQYIHAQRNNDPSLGFSVVTTSDLVYGTWSTLYVTVEGTNFVDGSTFDSVTNTVATDADELFIRLDVTN